MTDWARDNFQRLCAEAGLTPFHTRCLLLSLTGLNTYQIARTLAVFPATLAAKHRNRRLRRLEKEAREALVSAKVMLAAAYPEGMTLGRRFAADLTRCCENKGFYDERPSGVSGVAAAPEAKGFRVGRIVAADDRRLVQDAPSCAVLWARDQLAAVG